MRKWTIKNLVKENFGVHFKEEKIDTKEKKSTIALMSSALCVNLKKPYEQ